MEMEKKCKTCNLRLPINNFYKNTSYNDGRYGDCIPCYNIKRREYNRNRYNEPVEKHRYNDESRYLQLKGIKKEDYMMMYELCDAMGYDSKSDFKTIHEQFIEKWNNHLTEPLKVKEREKRSVSYYLSNGSINPEYDRS